MQPELPSEFSHVVCSNTASTACSSQAIRTIVPVQLSSRVSPFPLLKTLGQEAIRNKCIASSNRCLTSSNKKLLFLIIIDLILVKRLHPPLTLSISESLFRSRLFGVFWEGFGPHVQ